MELENKTGDVNRRGGRKKRIKMNEVRGGSRKQPTGHPEALIKTRQRIRHPRLGIIKSYIDPEEV